MMHRLSKIGLVSFMYVSPGGGGGGGGGGAVTVTVALDVIEPLALVATSV